MQGGRGREMKLGGGGLAEFCIGLYWALLSYKQDGPGEHIQVPLLALFSFLT